MACTDAYVFYGFDFFDGEGGLGERPTWGFEPEFNDDEDPISWADWSRADKLSEEIKTRIADLHIRIDSHCSCDYPIYFICTEESFMRANRGYPKTLQLATGPTATKRIKEACALLDIHYEEPRWWLASYWG